MAKWHFRTILAFYQKINGNIKIKYMLNYLKLQKHSWINLLKISIAKNHN